VPSREHCFPADHPAAPGHFPGNPIIPGAVLLSEVLRSVEITLGVPAWPCRIRSAKFVSPVRPGDRVLIECSPGGTAGAVRFRCFAGSLEVLRGEVTCGGPVRGD
jgi:3-hydroxyacyl-[acyl-carrier-protein] dehydratase